MIEEDDELADWLKIPSEVQVSLGGASRAEALRYLLRTAPHAPLTRKLLRSPKQLEELEQRLRELEERLRELEGG